MTERSRRGFLRAAVIGGAAAGGAVLMPAGLAQAAGGRPEPDCGCAPAPGAPGAPGSPGAPGAVTYELVVTNNSTQFQDLCVYQTPVDLGVPNALSLAWLTAPAWPGTTVTFSWTQQYNFVWGDTDVIVPGSTFRAGQVWPADPADPAQQQVLLDYASGAYTFRQGQATANPQAGSLYIRELAGLPVGDEAAVGIGMSGAGTFVVPAQPNVNLVFTPHPRYWITAGTFDTGQVLDIEQITTSAQVDFPSGVHSMNATLGSDGNWTVTVGRV